MKTYLIPFAISMAAITVITTVACGDAPRDIAATPTTETPATVTQIASVTTTTVPATAEQTSIPVITVTTTPEPATSTPESSVTATPSPVAEELPTVLWMLSDHAGPGVVTIRWATSVPTTGEVRVMTNHSGDEYFFSDTSDVAATEHAVSVPANFGRYTVLVHDAFGQEATATLRYEKDPQGIEWGTRGLAPSVKPDGSKHLLIQWGFVAGHQGNAFPASAQIFTKDADCTTADACQGAPLGEPLAAQREHSPGADTYSVYTTIPGRDYDYQVLVTQPKDQDNTAVTFLQLEIRGDELPKTVIKGAGNITS